eukprot:SAG11_NODE_5563_length_1523_cov_1.122191_3_plen_179_part_00
MLDANADANALSSNSNDSDAAAKSWTALHHAANLDDAACVALLLRAGCDATAKAAGNTAQEIALRRADPAVVAAFRSWEEEERARQEEKARQDEQAQQAQQQQYAQAQQQQQQQQQQQSVWFAETEMAAEPVEVMTFRRDQAVGIQMTSSLATSGPLPHSSGGLADLVAPSGPVGRER